MFEKILQNMKLTVADNGALQLAAADGHAFLSEGMPFEIAVDGGSPMRGAELKEATEADGCILLRYDLPASLAAEVRLEPTAGASVLRQTVTVTNNGDEPHTLTHLSSAALFGVGGEGERTWYDPEKLLLHYATSDWMKEGQWKARTMPELGVIPACHHPWERPSVHFLSSGSWATAKYYPLFILEDRETETVYYVELEGAVSWEFCLSHIGGYGKNGVNMSINAATAENGWHEVLAPGASYTTVPAVYGCTKGNMDDAVREMLVYRRASTAYGFAGEKIPLVFNDYMNCVWGHQSDKVLLPLIKAAGEAGVEYFCLDAGWYRSAKEGAGGAKGDWAIADERFGEGGLAGIFAAIRAAGMLPGVWFEWEAVNPNAATFKLSPDCLLARFGHPINKDGSYLFNLRSPAVRAHLHERVDALYDMGVRFIKNDYNFDTGIGSDMYGTSLAEGTRLASEALYSFVEEIKAKHPDLLIENCGSGALREENGTLRHFDLQSTSDQEYYENYPSIINGTLSFMAPEKAGIWAYPHPATFEMLHSKEGLAPETFAQYADGENTIFNMVNGMCGMLYLSGRIEYMDDANRALLHEGTATYKEIRDTISSATPVFPLPRISINEDGFAAQGLLSKEGDELLLAVWRIRAEGDTVRIPLAKYAPGYKAEMLYPADPRGASYSYDGETLTVTLPKSLSARFFRLKK